MIKYDIKIMANENYPYTSDYRFWALKNRSGLI